MKTLILSLIAAATLAGALPAMAQPAMTQPAMNASIPAREHMQQQRIAQGARTGALTPRQTARLERREIATHRLAVSLREAHGGRLTRHDRMVVRHALNRNSRAIYRLKHDHRVG
jgi:hypothetical protein